MASNAERTPALTVCSASARPVPRASDPKRVPAVKIAVTATTLMKDGASSEKTAWKFLSPTSFTLKSRPIVAPVVE